MQPGFATIEHPTPAQLAAAVNHVNARPAEADPVAQLFDMMQTRLERIEACLNLLVPLLAVHNPGLKTYAAGEHSAEAVTDIAHVHAADQAALLERLRVYFDEHLRGKF